MAVAAPARSRRAPAPARTPASRRPPLSVVAPRHRPPLLRRRRALALGVALASVLAVGGAHAYLVEGQVRLARLQQQLAAAQVHQRDLEVEVARLQSPSQVVAQGTHQGLAVPSQVTDLPLVPASSASAAPASSAPAAPASGASGSASASGATGSTGSGASSGTARR
jgi:hypothetical protein